MILDPGRAGFPGEDDDRKEDCRPEQRHDNRGVTSQANQIENPRSEITSILGLADKWSDIADRDPNGPCCPERHLGI